MSDFQKLVEALELFRSGECDAFVVVLLIESLIENRIEANK